MYGNGRGKKKKNGEGKMRKIKNAFFYIISFNYFAGDEMMKMHKNLSTMVARYI